MGPEPGDVIWSIPLGPPRNAHDLPVPFGVAMRRQASPLRRLSAPARFEYCIFGAGRTRGLPLRGRPAGRMPAAVDVT
jgi:hypothetical protein